MCDGDLPGLNYFTTCGINPIVQKMPYNLQEKWLSHSSRFKEEYNVDFPLFGYHVHFVCQRAKMQNYPSFSLFPGSTDPPVEEKSAPKYSSQRPHKSIVDPAKQCPLHNKPHRLQKCRGFREKSIDNWKALLKQHGICYECCGSSAHRAINEAAA